MYIHLLVNALVINRFYFSSFFMSENFVYCMLIYSIFLNFFFFTVYNMFEPLWRKTINISPAENEALPDRAGFRAAVKQTDTN